MMKKIIILFMFSFIFISCSETKKEFYENGKIKCESEYKWFKKNGITKEYDEDGNLKRVFTFKDDKRNGIFQYYSNNTLEIEAYFINDKLNGEVKRYFLGDGKIRNEATYKDDKLDGIFKEYDANGNLSLERTYKFKMLNGLTKVYYKNGNIKYSVEFQDDMVKGKFESYSKNGEEIYEATLNKTEVIDSRKVNDSLNSNKYLDFETLKWLEQMREINIRMDLIEIYSLPNEIEFTEIVKKLSSYTKDK